MHRGSNLISPEKGKRVIYLERRGKEGKNMSVSGTLLIILGVLCILYCVGIGLFVNFGTKFFLVWGVGGVLLVTTGYLVSKRQLLEHMPVWMKAVIGIALVIGLVIFVSVESLVVSRFAARGVQSADYLIVLGAQIYENGPSDVLRRRLDVAAAYLKENPDTLVIVSGGKGSNEPVTEAQGMYEYLLTAGIGADRILKEDTSGNTYENLLNSSHLLHREEDKIIVVTNNFHVYRATKIAEKMGYADVYGLAADSYPLMLPNNMLREFFGIIKDFLWGNL